MKKQPRIKSDKHLKFIRSLPCLCCGNNVEVEAAHVSYACHRAGKRERGVGEKADDCWAVPLCGKEHKEQHAMGDERKFWALKGIDPIFVALALHRISGDHEAGENIIRAWSGGWPRSSFV